MIYYPHSISIHPAQHHIPFGKSKSLGPNIGLMLILNNPKWINNLSFLFDRHLFEVQMRAICCFHSRVSIVLALHCGIKKIINKLMKSRTELKQHSYVCVKGTPIWHIIHKRCMLFFTTSRTSCYMNRSTWICVWRIMRAIVHFVIVHWPQPLVGMFVSPNFHIHTVIIEKIFQSEKVCQWKSDAQHRFILLTIIIADIATVHGPMAKCDDPWPLFSD